jgi:2-methylaconitate cis-trans-isomerase PrpF
MFTRRLHNMALRPLRRTFAAAAARQGSLPASFYRGGTSKALIFQRDHLPADRKEQDAVLLAAMGSPDPNGRQLDGMGGGYSSVSKVLIVGRSDHPDADVDYTFAQVLVDQPGASSY